MPRPVRNRKQVELFGTRLGDDELGDSLDEGDQPGKQPASFVAPEDDDEDALAGFTKKKSRIPKAAKGRKTAKATTAGTLTASSKPTTSAAPRNKLFAAVSGGKGIQEAAATFLNAFQSEATRDKAKVDFLNFVLRCAGASDDVLDSSCDVDSLDISDLLGEVGSVLETDQTYPLLMSPHPLAIPHGDGDKLERRDDFRDRLTKLLSSLVADADADTLFGEAQLAECIQDFLIAISSATLRSLRHTATFAGMTWILSILEKAETSRRNALSLQPQLESEEAVLAKLQPSKSKSAGAKAFEEQSRKVQQLSRQIEAFDQQVASAAEAADVAFKSIFMHRYRDVAADIRAEALQCFGTWIVSTPSVFLANSYLKYLGWMLSDQESACVRVFALHSILAIYDKLPSEQIPKITEFMVRFRSRIAKMTHDPSSTVAVCAVQTLHKAMLFDQLVMSEVQEVHDCLLDSHIEVRQAAGSFLVDQLPAFAASDEGDVEMVSASKAGKKSKASSAANAELRRHKTQLLSLIELIHALLPAEATESLAISEANDSAQWKSKAQGFLVADLVVSAFWGHKEAAVLTSWAAQANLLQHGGKEPGADEGPRSQLDEAADTGLSAGHMFLALALFCCCFARACGSTGPAGDAAAVPAVGKVSAAGSSPASTSDVAGVINLCWSREDVERSKDASSSEIAHHLPEILFQFGSDSFCANLVASHVLGNMSVGAFTVARANKAFGDVLFHLDRLFEQHDDEVTLASISNCWGLFATSQHTRAREADAKVRALLESLTSKLQKAASAIVGRPSKKRTSNTAAASSDWLVLAHAAKRVRLLLSCLPPEYTPTEYAVTVNAPLLHLLLQVLTLCRRMKALLEGAETTTKHGGATFLIHALPGECMNLCVLILLREFTALATAEKAVTDTTAAGGPSSAIVQAAVTPFAEFSQSLLKELILYIGLRHPSLYTDDMDDEAVENTLLTTESYKLPKDIPLRERNYIWRCRTAGFSALELLIRTLAPSALQGTTLHQLAIKLQLEHPHVLTAFVNVAMSASSTELVCMGYDIPGVTAKVAAKLLEATSSKIVKMKVADMYDDDDDDAEVAEACQRVKADAILLPLARMALAEPSFPRLGHLLGRRILEEENDAGSFGVAVVRAHSKKLKERSPEAWFEQQLHSIEESCKVLYRLYQEATALEEEDDTESAAASRQRTETVVERVTQLVRKQMQVLGVIKGQKAWWGPLTRALQKGSEDALAAGEKGKLMFSFLTFYIQFLPQHCAQFVYGTATNAAAASAGTTPSEASSFLSAATVWWDAIGHNTRKKGKKNAITEVPSNVEGFSSEELRPWAPYVAFVQALARLHEGGEKGSQQQSNAAALQALRVALKLSSEVEAGLISPVVGSAQKPGKSTVKSKAKPRAAVAYYDEDEDGSDSENETMPPTNSRGRQRPRTSMESAPRGGGAKTGSGPRWLSAADDIDDEIASQTQQVDLTPQVKRRHRHISMSASLESDDEIED